jgi:hypothetical protein
VSGFCVDCSCWGTVRLLTSLLVLQFDVFVDVDGENMRDGSVVCPEIKTWVAVCRVLYTLSPADLVVAEGVRVCWPRAFLCFVLR